jgi:hypothetical protein
MRLPSALVVLLSLGAGACGPGAESPAGTAGLDTTSVSDSVSMANTVDQNIPPAVAGGNGWEYFQSVESDLDGDGTPERAVITARVAMMNGRPVWDDGQPWQVYIESSDSTRTYVYARQLQLGTLTMRLTRGEGDTLSTILLIEHLPDVFTLYEAEYGGPGDVQVREQFRRRLDPYGDLASPALP